MKVIREDITTLKVDAIVNAANNSLAGGGGVDGAIHRAGGKQILHECMEWVNQNGPLDTGDAMITSGGNLPSRFVIHTVGPVWKGGNKGEPELLASCYRRSLEIATANHLESIAFPNISTGIYGFPKKDAANIAVRTVTEFLKQDQSVIKVTFCCFDKENFDLYMEQLIS